MNKSYIIPRLVLVLLTWVFFYFAFDPILKWGATKSLETVFNAKVEISKIKTSFLHPSLRVYGFKAGDSQNEYRNLFEFDSLHFSMNGKQILEKKFIIDDASIKGLRFLMPRKTSCKIYTSKTEMPEFIEKYMNQTKSYSLQKVEGIKTDAISNIEFEANSLKSVKLINELNEKYKTQYKVAMEKADFSKYQEKLDEINNRYAAIKSEKNFIKQIKEVSKLKKDISSLLKEYESDRKMISSIIKDSASFYKELNEAKREDIEKISSMAKLPTLDKEKIAEIILGEEVYANISKWLNISKHAAKYIPENPKKKIFSEKSVRGRIISFPKLENYPRFLLKKASIEGVLSPQRPISYSGYIANMTNQPSLWQYPLTAEIKGSEKSSSVYFKTEIDLSKDKSKSYTTLEYKGANLAQKTFGKNTSFALTLEKAKLDYYLKVKTYGKEIDGVFEANFNQTEIKPDASLIKYEPLKASIENSFSAVKSFSARVIIKGNIESPSISIKTDLADIFNDAMKKAVGEEIQKAKKQIEEKIDSEINKHKEKMDKIIKENKEKLDSILKSNDNKINSWEKDLSQKLKKSITNNTPKIKF